MFAGCYEVYVYYVTYAATRVTPARPLRQHCIRAAATAEIDVRKALGYYYHRDICYYAA